MQPSDAQRMWVRFEGPGKLHTHRWHQVKPSPLGGFVTLCGMYVHHAPLSETPGAGTICGNCAQLAQRVRGGYL
jgi:hypothetical protein